MVRAATAKNMYGACGKDSASNSAQTTREGTHPPEVASASDEVTGSRALIALLAVNTGARIIHKKATSPSAPTSQSWSMYSSSI